MEDSCYTTLFEWDIGGRKINVVEIDYLGSPERKKIFNRGWGGVATYFLYFLDSSKSWEKLSKFLLPILLISEVFCWWFERLRTCFHDSIIDRCIRVIIQSYFRNIHQSQVPYSWLCFSTALIDEGFSVSCFSFLGVLNFLRRKPWACNCPCIVQARQLSPRLTS